MISSTFKIDTFIHNINYILNWVICDILLLYIENNYSYYKWMIFSAYYYFFLERMEGIYDENIKHNIMINIT